MGKSIYTPELAERVLVELRQHGSTLKAAEAVGIDRSTIVRWTEAHPEFEQQYARAKADGIDALVEDTINIADEPPPSTAAGNIDTGAVQHAKLRIETRRWYAERLAARKYGARTGVDVTNSDGSMAMDDTARAARFKALLALAAQRKGEPPIDVDELV